MARLRGPSVVMGPADVDQVGLGLRDLGVWRVLQFGRVG
jgi:hypothetical protein